MKGWMFLLIFLWGCSGGDDRFLQAVQGRWLEKTNKQFYFEEWHKLDDGVWGGFSYVLPKKELQRIKRMRTFRVTQWDGKWVFLELTADSKKMDTLLLQPSEEPDTWVFKKEGREEMIRMDGKELTRNSVFPESSVLHHLKGYEPKNLREELPYSLIKGN
jgi:hypothetical protein